MFGRNEIVGRKFFADADDRLLVTSIFLTLQGEGPYQGRPAIFVRMAKCNLACSFCDTYFDKGDWFALNHLVGEVTGIGKLKYGYAMRRNLGLVITGGEPSLQTNVAPFLQRVFSEFAFTQIESNGIQLLEGLPRETTLVISPKCNEDEDGVAKGYLKPREAMLARADCMKFVMSCQIGSAYRDVPDWALEWRKETGKAIYVSPMNVYRRLPEKVAQMDLARERPDLVPAGADMQKRIDAEVISFWDEGLLDMTINRLNHEYAARYALAHGLQLTLQMHLYASLA